MRRKNSTIVCVVCFLMVLLWGTSQILSAKQRGLTVSKRSQKNGTGKVYGKSWAVIIGINKYKKWPKLDYAVHDAKGMKAALKKFGFTNFFELYDERATKTNILRVLGDELGNPDKIGENDRVLVFYAGHGQTRPLPRGRSLGYIIPVDADVDNYHSTAISMTNIRDFCELIPAKHLLFIMDSCYSGLALTTRGGPKVRNRKYLQEITRRRARQILTAGGADEEVADGGPNNHSVFTGFLIRGLEEKLADMDFNGIITATELAGYITPQVRSYSNQTPAFGTLVGNEGGDFVFTYVGKSTTSKSHADLAAFKAAKESNTIKAWESFIKKYPESDFAEDAKLSLQILRSEESAEELAEKAKLAEERRTKQIYLQQLEEKSFQSARKAATKEAWTAYLKNYPSQNKDHRTFAQKQLKLLNKPKPRRTPPKPVKTPPPKAKYFNLFYDEPAFFFANSKRSIKIEIEGNRKLIAKSTLYYRVKGKKSFTSTKMKKSRGTLVGYIPKKVLKPDVTIQYYMVVESKSGKFKTIGNRSKPLQAKTKKRFGQKIAPVINF